jgi:hypothetical protein
MGEVKKTNCFIDYRKAEGYEGINTARNDAVKKYLQTNTPSA